MVIVLRLSWVSNGGRCHAAARSTASELRLPEPWAATTQIGNSRLSTALGYHSPLSHLKAGWQCRAQVWFLGSPAHSGSAE